MAISSVNYKYFDSKSSEAFGGSWAQIFNRTLHQPLDLSQVQPLLKYFNDDLNDNGSTANMYKGQIVVVTSDDASSNTLTYSAYSPFNDKTGRTGPYLIYGYNSGTSSTDGTYFADRILTYTEQQAHYVRKYDLGAYYTGVGEWWQITRSTYADDKELARIYRDSVETFTSKQAAKFSYGEIFNDYVTNSAFGSYSHAEGYHNKALAYGSHSEGQLTIASGIASHSEGYSTTASGNYSHTEGKNTSTELTQTKEDGTKEIIKGEAAHAEGNYTVSSGTGSHSEGLGTSDKKTTASGTASHAEGYQTTASQSYAHSEGNNTIASGQSSHSEGELTEAKKTNSHSEGKYTVADGEEAHAEGLGTSDKNTTASGTASHAEGYSTTASGNYSHTEGKNTSTELTQTKEDGTKEIIKGEAAHAEGESTIAVGSASHAEGFSNQALGISSHAEGQSNKAIGQSSHAEGDYTIANGKNSHSQGYATYATKENSFAGGLRTYTDANNSIAHGTYIITGCENEAAFGKYNGNSQTTYTDRIFEIGIGTSHTARKNALEITSAGNVDITNKLAVGNGINVTNGGLTVTGNTTLNNNLSVGGTATVTGATTLNGATTINNTLNVTKDVDFDSKLNVDGTTTLNDKTTITKNGLEVTGNTILNGNLTVASSSTISMPFDNNGTGNESINNSNAGLLTNVNINTNGKLTYSATSLATSGSGNFLISYTIDKQGHFNSTFGSFTNTHTNTNKAYSTGTNVIAANSQVLTYAVIGADGHLFTYYGARPVLSVITGDTSQAVSGVTVSDHQITVGRTSLSVSSGTKSKLVSGGTLDITMNGTTTYQFVTGITQAANGKISYAFAGVNTTHSGSLTGSSANNQTIGPTSTAKATFVTAGSLSANGVLSGTTGTISHATIGKPGSYGQDKDITCGLGGSFSVPYITTNDCGHISEASSKNIKLPTLTNSDTGNAVTNVSYANGTITINKGNFATESQFNDLSTTVSNLSTIVSGKVINDKTINFYLSNTSTNGTTSSGSFTTNQSSNGSIYLNNVARTNSTNTFSGNQTATAWYVSSDINYKEIINDCKVTIDEIANLPIFDYIWKLDEENKIHTGSSAQSVETILPNLVTEDDKGIKSLDYASLGTIAGVVACREICKLRDKLDKIEKLISNK